MLGGDHEIDPCVAQQPDEVGRGSRGVDEEQEGSLRAFGGGTCGRERGPGGLMNPVVEPRDATVTGGHSGGRPQSRRPGVARPVDGRPHEVRLSLEGVQRCRDPPAPLIGIISRPVDVDAVGPEGAERRQHEGQCVVVVPGTGEGGQRGLSRRPHRVHSPEGGEGAPGSYFEKQRTLVGEKRADAVGEANRLPEVPHPIFGAGHFIAGHRSREVRHEGSRRGRQPQRGEVAAEGVQDSVEHVRMGRHLDADPARVDAGRAQLFGESIHGRDRSGGNRGFRSVDGRDREVVSQQGAQGFFSQADAEHGPRLDGLEQASPETHEGQRVFQREDPGQARRGVFPHGVTHHPGGVDAPTHPEAGLSDLHGEEAGQSARGSLKRRRRGVEVGVGAGEEEGAHIEVDDPVEDR